MFAPVTLGLLPTSEPSGRLAVTMVRCLGRADVPGRVSRRGETMDIHVRFRYFLKGTLRGIAGEHEFEVPTGSQPVKVRLVAPDRLIATWQCGASDTLVGHLSAENCQLE